ncbi:O-antigen translocase [Arenimonas sp.]|uniref:O-antigen translocase n=1 Tax=Arenimonas sp. TaxID=1872635 RepID=UPI0025C0A271|nr:O-antigen translocase [Arenimonas sp.]
MSDVSSYRQILRSSSITGGAAFINVLVSLLRTKAAAVLLGPAGVGLLGLFQNVMESAAIVSALGLGNAGARQIAEAEGRGDATGVAAARRALAIGTTVLAVVGAALVWLLRDPIAERVLGDSDRSREIGWLAVGVGLLVASASQGGLLIGLRRVGDLARLSVWSSILGTIFGVASLWVLGEKGLLIFLLAMPLSTYLVGQILVRRLPVKKANEPSLAILVVNWQALLRLGLAFMVVGLAVTMGQLAVRSMVQNQLGLDALGYFQAAWAVSMTYVGFVLAAMSSDYFPRLTATIRDHVAANRLVNQQTEVALLIAGPIFLTMLVFTPHVIAMLYSKAFDDSVTILRWQILGDILKLAGWPMGFIILAAGDGRTFVMSESLGISVFVLLVWLGLPQIGLQATGLAFIGMYLVYLPFVYWLAWRRTRFVWSLSVWVKFVCLLLAALLICILQRHSEVVAVACGTGAALCFALYSLARLSHMSNLGGIIGEIAKVSSAAIERISILRR